MKRSTAAIVGNPTGFEQPAFNVKGTISVNTSNNQNRSKTKGIVSYDVRPKCAACLAVQQDTAAAYAIGRPGNRMPLCKMHAKSVCANLDGYTLGSEQCPRIFVPSEPLTDEDVRATVAAMLRHPDFAGLLTLPE